MAAPADLLVLNGAPNQLDRALAAPKPDAVKVDGRSLADLLAFAPEYGALIRFYGPNDVADGDWSAFFLGDPSIGHALASLDLADAEALLDRLLAALSEADSFESRLGLVHEVSAVILRLIRIHRRERTNQADLERGLAGLTGTDRRDPLESAAGRLALHLGGGSLEHRLRHSGEDWFRQLLDDLEALVAALLTVLEQERGEALAALEASFDDHSHPPQSGLYDAFATLFRHAQDSINSFPERLIRFYQSEVLRQTRRAGTPDSVYLTFTPAKGFARAELPRFTQFLGTDADGESLAYALDSALSVDAASVATLRTLTVTSEAVGEAALPLPAQVLAGTVALADTEPRIVDPFPIFGNAVTGTDGVLTTALAPMGFAVASPTLMLTGGARTVTLRLTVAPGCAAALTKTLESLGAAAGGLAPSGVFIPLMEGAFALRYSTAGGWVDVKHYVVGYSPEDVSFTLSFLLGPNADPFVALSSEPDGGGAAAESATVPDTDMPTLVADLLQDPVVLSSPTGLVTAYPYALLSNMMLSSLSIDVAVAGLADLEASTPTGPVDTSQPFLVFGSPPVKDAALEIAAPELFAKRLTRLALAIQWFGLPTTNSGFKGYYEAYVIDADGNSVPPGSQFDNRSFIARLEVQNPGWWRLGETPSSTHYLFRTALGERVPCPDRALEPGSLFVAPVRHERLPPYYDPKLSAVRLRLEQPATAFGNVLYAPNVVAASVRLTAAASACAQRCAREPPETADDPLAPAIAVSRTAPDAELDRALEAAAQSAVASLDGAALTAIHDAIAASGADAATKEAWRQSLSDALGAPAPAGWFRRLFRWWRPGPDFATVHSNLDAWLAAHEGALAAADPALLGKARAALDAASGVLAVRSETAGQPPPIRRPLADAGLRDVQTKLDGAASDEAGACIQECMKGTDLLGFPNQPWLPMAASITVGYEAATELSPEGAEDRPPATLLHLLPLGGIEPATWDGGIVPLLCPVESPGALYVGLSEAAKQPTLLFHLAPPTGGWSTHTPPVSWAQATGESEWTALTVLRDGTNDLRNSGIVSLALADSSATQPLLRLSAPGDAAAFPMLAGLATNAAMASWVGPGGGARLGIPLPAGTVDKPASPLPALGSIDQPMPSSGGTPADTGAGFEKWLAERLRHKDRGIQPRDYSDLLLAAFPSLWQVAVVPASDGGGEPAPGNVWIVPIPGPMTPDVSDPAVPSCSATMRHDIADYLTDRISPFVQLTVTDPPYLRVQVEADLIFTDADSVEANIERLNAELIEFLSPWPPTTLPPRPDDYYTLKEVAHFIRHRPYVRAIVSLRLVPESITALAGWHYLTSAAWHSLEGKAQSASEPTLPPRLSLAAPAAAGGQA